MAQLPSAVGSALKTSDASGIEQSSPPSQFSCLPLANREKYTPSNLGNRGETA